MATGESRTGYSALSIALHWIAAISVFLMFAIGLRADSLGEAGDRAGRAAAMGWHVGLGSVLALILIWRIVAHYTQPQPAPPEQPRVLNIIASATHHLLLLAILVLVISGPLAVWSGGNPIRFAGALPIPSPFAERNEGVHELAEQLHGVGRYMLYVLIPLHVLGVAKHVFIDKDGVLRRMLVPQKPLKD